MTVVGAIAIAGVLVLALVLILTDDGSALDPVIRHRAGVSQPGATTAQLEVIGGTDSLTVSTADLGADLVQAVTPDSARAAPVVQLDQPGVVSVSTQGDQQPGHGDGPVALMVFLNRNVQWAVRVDGGTQLLRLDLSQARVRSVDVTQGVATVDAALPAPDGTMVTRISGGASAVRLHLPPGTAARFTFAAGAGSATVDSQQRQGLPAGTTITSDGWTGTEPNRIDVALDSGVGSLVSDRARLS